MGSRHPHTQTQHTHPLLKNGLATLSDLPFSASGMKSMYYAAESCIHASRTSPLACKFCKLNNQPWAKRQYTQARSGAANHTRLWKPISHLQFFHKLLNNQLFIQNRHPSFVLTSRNKYIGPSFIYCNSLCLSLCLSTLRI